MDKKQVLEIKGLTKKFGKFTAVDNVSFGIKKGEIVGLLGPNGAGKTTMFQMLLGVTKPTSGEIYYFGRPFFTNRGEILQKINHMSGYGGMPWRMTVYENLIVYCHLYQLKNYKEKIVNLLDTFEIKDLAKKPFRSLSSGQRTRVLLVKSLLNDPEILLLDEPTASLDPDIAEKTREQILNIKKDNGRSVLITSHNMQEVEELCDRVVFLNKGKVFAIDTPYGLAGRSNLSQLNLMIKDGLKRITAWAKKENYGFSARNRFVAITLPEKQIAFTLAELSRIGIEYDEIEIIKPNLEDFFLSVAKGGETN